MKMECQGDKVAGFNTDEPCYRVEACTGCVKCEIKCTGCANCKELKQLYQVPRKPEVSDYVVIHQKLILDPYFKHSWQPAMDDAIGRVGWVKSGNPTDGFKIKFTTTNTKHLDDFVFPQSSLRLAMPGDNSVDRMIHQTKEDSEDPNIRI